MERCHSVLELGDAIRHFRGPGLCGFSLAREKNWLILVSLERIRGQFSAIILEFHQKLGAIRQKGELGQKGQLP